MASYSRDSRQEEEEEDKLDSFIWPSYTKFSQKYSGATSPQLAAPSKPEMLLGEAIVRRCLACQTFSALRSARNIGIL
ncbi:hypothetical protein E2C01_100691 [Portunus trituberculatus]|uniref:Uncharacterized protein n=1 Tax=Portunus trituberculatus TaxID=210409 RepID=A0A5B7KDN9_PORTR|nr:hypothetical protein [Portunus trituberculatus]